MSFLSIHKARLVSDHKSTFPMLQLWISDFKMTNNINNSRTSKLFIKRKCFMQWSGKVNLTITNNQPYCSLWINWILNWIDPLPRIYRKAAKVRVAVMIASYRPSICVLYKNSGDIPRTNQYQYWTYISKHFLSHLFYVILFYSSTFLFPPLFGKG